MPENPAFEPFLLNISPSPGLRRLSVFLHVAACCASFYNALPVLIQSLLCLGVMLSALLTDSRLKSHTLTIRYSIQSGWEIANADNFEPVTLLQSSFFTTALIILQMRRFGQGKITLVIMPDAIGQEPFRQLLRLLNTVGR